MENDAQAGGAAAISRRNLLTIAGTTAAATALTGVGAFAQPRRGRRILLRGGEVLSMTGAASGLRAADVLIDGDRIVAIGPKIQAGDADIVDARLMTVMPGLVDAHRHLWETTLRAALPIGTLQTYQTAINRTWAPLFEPEDAYLGTLLGALGALETGVTTVLNWSHISSSPAHVEAVITAMRDAGVRGVYAHGRGARQGSPWPGDLLAIRDRWFTSPDGLLTLGLATTSPEFAPLATVREHLELARRAGALTSIHAGLRGIGRAGAIAELGRAGLLGPDVNLVHCNMLSGEEWSMIAAAGASVTITPTVEMQMGFGPSPVEAARRRGIPFSLGVDVETSAPADLWTQLRAAYAQQHATAFAPTANGESGAAPMTPLDALRAGTVNGARACRLNAKIGTIAVGKQADLILLRKDRVETMGVDGEAGVLLTAHGGSVDAVLVAGRFRKRDGKLLHPGLDRLRERVVRSRERLLSRAAAPPRA